MKLKEFIKHHIGGCVYYAIGKDLLEINHQNWELLWARIWDDTCRDIEWIKELPGISPGRFAVGYNYIYVMTRALNELRPHNILDLGLGISSTLISSYVSYYSALEVHPYEHIVVEQEPKWIDVYTASHRLDKATTILHRPCEEITYKGESTFSYNDFESVVKGKKFDVISIDGPWGGDRYSRRDLVPHLPEILNDSFVIIVDDANRLGEQDTVAEIIDTLNKVGIETKSSTYQGYTDCTVIVSADNEYMCTL